eukprot:7381203-Prymnesium_polylepis.1
MALQPGRSRQAVWHSDRLVTPGAAPKASASRPLAPWPSQQLVSLTMVQATGGCCGAGNVGVGEGACGVGGEPVEGARGGRR